MAKIKQRHELKHVVTIADALMIRNKVSCMLRPDVNAGPDGRYHIRSLYFDTPEDKALTEKMEGFAIKEKFRFRFYNHNHDFIRLEKKIKQNSMTAKTSVPLTKSEIQAILGGNISLLKDADHPLLREFYLKLKTERLEPKVIVDYMREAYQHPIANVRVTMDNEIRTSISSTDLFDTQSPSASALNSGLYILEIKYDHFLPEFVQDIVQLNNCTSTAFSKFAACRLYNTASRGLG